MSTTNPRNPGLFGSTFARVARAVTSAAVVAMLVVAMAPAQVACSGGAGATCSADEEKKCTDTFDACVQNAAMAADKNACLKCVDDYCNCYSACGNSCDRDKLTVSCQ